MPRLCLIVSFALAVVTAVPAAAFTYVVFRYEGLAGDAPGVRAISAGRLAVWQAEQAMDTAFADLGLPYVAAVIPYAGEGYAGVDQRHRHVAILADVAKTALLRQAVAAGRLEIAQHGYCHLNHALAHQRPGEFRGRTLQDQVRDISAGAALLAELSFNIPPVSFVPPFNSWDGNTAKALQANMFSILSADRQFFAGEARTLNLVPYTAELHELEAMLANPYALAADSVIVVRLHPAQIASLPGQGNHYFGLERLQQLLFAVAARPELQVVTLRQLIHYQALPATRYRTAYSLWKLRAFWTTILPEPLLPGQSTRALYLPLHSYARILPRWQALTILVIVGSFWVGGRLSSSARHHLPAARQWSLDAAAVLGWITQLLLLLRLINAGFHPTATWVLPFAVSTGFLVGICRAYLQNRVRLRRCPALAAEEQYHA